MEEWTHKAHQLVAEARECGVNSEHVFGALSKAMRSSRTLVAQLAAFEQTPGARRRDPRDLLAILDKKVEETRRENLNRQVIVGLTKRTAASATESPPTLVRSMSGSPPLPAKGKGKSKGKPEPPGYAEKILVWTVC